MNKKFFLFSKTIIGILIMVFVFLFGDQLGMPDDVKKWLFGFGAALAGLGRFVARDKLVLKPGKDEAPPGGPGLMPAP